MNDDVGAVFQAVDEIDPGGGAALFEHSIGKSRALNFPIGGVRRRAAGKLENEGIAVILHHVVDYAGELRQGGGGSGQARYFADGGNGTARIREIAGARD